MDGRSGYKLQSWIDGDSRAQPWYAADSLYGRSSATPDRGVDYAAWARDASVSGNGHEQARGPGTPHPNGLDRTGLLERAGDVPAGMDGSE